jgi:hypothetical protein
MFSIERCTSLLDDCKKLVPQKETAFHFDRYVSVKITPHNEVCRIWGYCLTNDDKLMLTDDGVEWFEILPNQVNAGYVIQTLFQRLTTIKNERKTNNSL